MTLTRTDLLARLRERGVTRVEIDFEGGDDEGGANSIALYRDDELVDDLPTWFAPGAPADDTALVDALTAPIYDRWSFNGSPYVRGTLTWDVTEGTARVTGAEEVMEDFDYEA